MRFSNRLNWSAATNRLFSARQQREAAGAEILDLTETNPTCVGLQYPVSELAEILAKTGGAKYEPDPMGLRTAREALSEELSRGNAPVSPDDLLLTASTSEAYSFLFKLLTDPGDVIATAAPTYPLLDHLTGLESLRLEHFPLSFESRWTLDSSDLERSLKDERARAVVVVHPNNPTGSLLTTSEQDAIALVCRRRDLVLISDEVFSDYRFVDSPFPAAAPAADREDILSFSLGGLSKSAGLPHWKLSWIRVGGPQALRRQALAALELIADSYLSVTTAAQLALREVLGLSPRIRGSIRDRLDTNLAAAREITGGEIVQLYPIEAGWSVVLRIPAVDTDEDLALDLLNSYGVLVHPGYFFDFATDGFLVISLLPRPEIFADGMGRLTRWIGTRLR